MPENKIFCAIDKSEMDESQELISKIAPVTGAIKFGLEFFNAQGPQGIESLMESVSQAEFFIDLKYHDIPNTVSRSIKALTEHFGKSRSPAYLNLHCTGGEDMMKAARQACPSETRLLGVTILTSMDQEMLRVCGFNGSVTDNVRRLAAIAKKSGLDGVVCSAHEIRDIREECGDDFELMVPGIRPQNSDNQDQKRVMTPCEAIQAGASHLVIGRPITGHTDPARAAKNILQEIKRGGAI